MLDDFYVRFGGDAENNCEIDKNKLKANTLAKILS